MDPHRGDKSGASNPVLPGTSTPPDCVAGGPLFDETPARGPPVVSDCVPSRVVAPVSDRTPMQQSGTHQSCDDLPNQSLPEHTPQWQDTPSQSLVGPEEATQEHNVEAQLEKYNKEHEARLARHLENVKLYYRKYPNRQKDANVDSSIPGVDSHEDLDSAPQNHRKERVAAAKKKIPRVPRNVIPVGTTTRHSPRLEAMLSSDSLVGDPASPVRKGRERRVEFYDNYVPDEVDAGEDAGAFCSYKEMANTDRWCARTFAKSSGKKRKGRVLKEAECSTLDEVLDYLPVAKKKKQSVIRKAKAIKAGNESDDDCTGTFQQTVRCSIGEVIEAAKLLKKPHRDLVREAGFGSVFDWILDGNVSLPLQCVLLMRMDTSTIKIDCGPGRTVVANREFVRHIFGFPMGGETVPRPSNTGHDAALSKLKAELGFVGNASIEPKHLRKLLAELVEDESKVHIDVKVFFGILYNKLICPGSTLRIGREAAMLEDMDYKKMARSDFCQLVVDELKRSAEKYQDTSIPQGGPEGHVLVPLIQYLDSYYSKQPSIMHRRTPRANFLDKKTLKHLYLKDQKKEWKE